MGGGELQTVYGTGIMTFGTPLVSVRSGLGTVVIGEYPYFVKMQSGFHGVLFTLKLSIHTHAYG